MVTEIKIALILQGRDGRSYLGNGVKETSRVVEVYLYPGVSRK